MRLPALQSPSLLETAAALPHVHGLSPARSTTAAPPHPGPIGGRCAQPHPPVGRGRSGQDPGRFPCSLWFARRRRSPTMPLRPRCGYAADLPRSLPGSSCPPPREFPAHHARTGARRFRPRSTRFEPAPHQGDVTRRFLTYSSPSRLPDPHHLAVLARPGFVRAAPTLPGTTRIRLPSAPPPCCDRISGEGLSPPLEPQRLTAHPRPAAHLCVSPACAECASAGGHGDPRALPARHDHRPLLARDAECSTRSRGRYEPRPCSAELNCVAVSVAVNSAFLASLATQLSQD